MTCHAMPVTASQVSPTIAPCGATIQPATAAGPGDGFSASTRFIDCPACVPFATVFGVMQQLDLVTT